MNKDLQKVQVIFCYKKEIWGADGNNTNLNSGNCHQKSFATISVYG